MRSVRARVFVTTAAVLAAATLVAGLLSRQATLVEERQFVGAQRPPAIPGVPEAAQQAYTQNGWPGVRRVLVDAGKRVGVRFLAIDTALKPVAASTPDLDLLRVRQAGPDGLSVESSSGDARASFELRGLPTFVIRDAEGLDAGRVYVMPGDAAAPPVRSSMPALWIRSTIATAVVALVLAFVLGGRILRPVSELTAAARRMREGELDVRVSADGDDELARLGRAFNEMAERLAQTEKLKRQMVSDVAHELRSPVTNLRCALEAIQDGLAAPDRARIDMLHSETLLLQRLIGDLQDLALADAGGLSLRRETVDVADIARRAAGSDNHAPEVSISVSPEASTVVADAARLEQMLRNLVNNARRHTPPQGRISITVTRDGSTVSIAVADSGSGITPEHLPYVFDRFYRADPSRDRSTGGAGLGLAIVRRFAEAHGGSVTASSDGEGRGATFIVRLPQH
jgi:two-component system sensor histidine kinase BaeS